MRISANFGHIGDSVQLVAGSYQAFSKKRVVTAPGSVFPHLFLAWCKFSKLQKWSGNEQPQSFYDARGRQRITCTGLDGGSG